MEMVQLILKYPEVHTDMIFVNIPTRPLEYRNGTERCHKSSTVEDGAYLEIETVIIREEKNFPEWRLHTDSQRLILNGLRQTDSSIDKITKFSVRPPELLKIFDQVGNYFRWFHISKKEIKPAKLDDKLNIDMKKIVLLTVLNLRCTSE